MNSANRNAEHLNVLAVFHYVAAGLIALTACIPIIHLVIGVVMLVAPQAIDRGHGPPTWVGLLFIAIAGLVIALGWLLAIAVLFAGRCLAKRRSYMYCLVVAGVLCVLVPLGTVLGVFSIVVLLRPDVKSLFEPQPTLATPVKSGNE